MGADFVEKAAPNFTKAWDYGKVELGTDSLLRKEIIDGGRSVALKLSENTVISEGEVLTVYSEGSDLLARRGIDEVARTDNPPLGALKAIKNSCGLGSGRVDTVHDEARVIEVTLS